jgi:hypothetical protein
MIARTLTATDLNWVVRRLPKDIQDALRASPGRLYVAGGFIRDTIAGLEVKDLDLWGCDKLLLDATAKVLERDRKQNGQLARLHKTDNAITLLTPPRMPVQLITRWTFDDAQPMLETLDFTVCQAAVWFAGGAWRSMCSEAFYPDLAARRLVYTFPQREEEAGGSLLRVTKFLRRGWSIQPESLAGVVARVAQKVKWDRLDAEGGKMERLGNDREVRAAKVISGLLREVDPLLVVDGLEPIDDEDAIR